MEPTIFYYSDGKNQFGPFSKEEMKSKSIQADTLVWFEGLTEWKRAKDVPEMKEFLPVAPPPLPKAAPVPVPPPPPPAPVTVPQPPAQPAPQPPVQPAPKPVQCADPQPVQPVSFTELPPRGRKKFTLLLFIFSFVGMVMSLSMIGYASFLVANNDWRYNSYWDDFSYGIENEGWGTYFIFVAIFLLVFSILMCVKMAKQLRNARRAR